MIKQVTTKQCYQCKQIKSISEFYKHPHMKDGHLNFCKSCKKEYHQSAKGKAFAKQYRESEKGKISQKKATRKHQQTVKYKTYQKKYHQSEKGKSKQILGQKRFRVRHPERYKAACTVNNAIKNSKLFRPDTLQCTYCPTQAKQYHHPDYSKPLYVFPVCIDCHHIIHN